MLMHQRKCIQVLPHCLLIIQYKLSNSQRQWDNNKLPQLIVLTSSSTQLLYDIVWHQRTLISWVFLSFLLSSALLLSCQLRFAHCTSPESLCFQHIQSRQTDGQKSCYWVCYSHWRILPICGPLDHAYSRWCAPSSGWCTRMNLPLDWNPLCCYRPNAKKK